MNPVPLVELRLRPRHHLPALWWLALLYRRPRVFQLDLEKLGRGQQVAVAVRMYLHGLPYVVVIAVLGRILVFGAFGIALEHAPADLDAGSLVSFHGPIDFPSFHAVWIAGAIAGSIAVGIVAGIAGGIAGGIAAGIAFGIAGGIAGGIVGLIVVGIAFAIALGIAGGIAGSITGSTTGGIALGMAAIAVGIVFGIAGGIAGAIAFVITNTRAYYLVGHLFFVWPGSGMVRAPADELAFGLVLHGIHLADDGATRFEALVIDQDLCPTFMRTSSQRASFRLSVSQGSPLAQPCGSRICGVGPPCSTILQSAYDAKGGNRVLRGLGRVDVLYDLRDELCDQRVVPAQTEDTGMRWIQTLRFMEDIEHPPVGAGRSHMLTESTRVQHRKPRS